MTFGSCCGRVLPDDLAVLGQIEREDRVRERRVHVHHVADHQRRALVPAQHAGGEGPGDLEVADVLLVDLVELRVAGVGVVHRLHARSASGRWSAAVTELFAIAGAAPSRSSAPTESDHRFIGHPPMLLLLERGDAARVRRPGTRLPPYYSFIKMPVRPVVNATPSVSYQSMAGGRWPKRGRNGARPRCPVGRGGLHEPAPQPGGGASAAAAGRLDIGDDVGPLLGLLHAREGHLGARV